MKKAILLFWSLFLLVFSAKAQKIAQWNDQSKNYWIEIYSDDSLSLISYKYDSINNLSNISTYRADGFFKPVYDTTLQLINYKLHGTSIEFYTNKKVKEIKSYYLDQPIGEWVFYYQSGQTKKIENYPSDSLIHLLCDDYSTIVSDHESVGGASSVWTKKVPHGEWIEFYEDGQIKVKKYFHLGLAKGTWKWFYENGLKKKEGKYLESLHGQYPCKVDTVTGIILSNQRDEIWATELFVHLRPKDGEWKYWNQKGDLILIEEYDKGKLIKKKEDFTQHR